LSKSYGSATSVNATEETEKHPQDDFFSIDADITKSGKKGVIGPSQKKIYLAYSQRTKDSFLYTSINSIEWKRMREEAYCY